MLTIGMAFILEDENGVQTVKYINVRLLTTQMRKYLLIIQSI